MKKRFLSAAATAAIVGTGAFAGPAAATPAEGDLERTDISKGTTDAPIAIVAAGQQTAFYIQEVELAPGASSGWHTHSGPEYSNVTDGTVWVQSAPGCAAIPYSAGQSVFVQTGVPHRVFNQGTDDAVATVTYTLPAQNPVRDDAPAACP
ncbi:cupin domain-containing protein [Mycobacterium deserti]|uniref:Cupin domain-containing protein n=1 Tax=Mycobacterium deserti TaxID=2978347 RepID=A0ABT2MCP8_9MYCO|nr:cupin domain-containing protein [Mycobacterium deserti]MCT7658756.1 cupin domain-containing protein [Mycobacterium deserti]